MQLQLGWHERCFYGISPRLFSQDAAILAFVFFRCLCCLFQPATFFHLASSVCWFSDHRFLLNIPPVLMNFNLILIVVALIDKKNTSKASDCVSSHRLVCLEYAQTELDTVGLYWRDAHDNIQYKCYFLPEYLLLRVQHDIYTFIFNYLWSYSQHFHLKSAEKKNDTGETQTEKAIIDTICMIYKVPEPHLKIGKNAQVNIQECFHHWERSECKMLFYLISLPLPVPQPDADI